VIAGGLQVQGYPRLHSKLQASLDFTEIQKPQTVSGAVPHIYNPSYSEGGDREDCDLGPAQAEI
jgi:hypothetical protein